DVQSSVLVLDVLGRADLDASEGVDDVAQTAEADLGVAVDAQARLRLERLDQQRGTAPGVGRVDLRAAVTRDVDLGVAGDRRQHGRAATAVRQQQDGVGAAAGRVLGSLVRADQQPRRRRVIGALTL